MRTRRSEEINKRRDLFEILYCGNDGLMRKGHSSTSIWSFLNRSMLKAPKDPNDIPKYIEERVRDLVS